MNLAATCIERTHRGTPPRPAITAPPNEHRDFVDEATRLRTFEISALSRGGHVERYTPPRNCLALPMPQGLQKAFP